MERLNLPTIAVAILGFSAGVSAAITLQAVREDSLFLVGMAAIAALATLPAGILLHVTTRR